MDDDADSDADDNDDDAEEILDPAPAPNFPGGDRGATGFIKGEEAGDDPPSEPTSSSSGIFSRSCTYSFFVILKRSTS